MRHTHLKEPIALFSQCAARWRVEAVLDFSIKIWPTVKEMHSGTPSVSSWLGGISQRTYKQFSKGNTTQWIFIVHLMHTKELTWRPEEKGECKRN